MKKLLIGIVVVAVVIVGALVIWKFVLPFILTILHSILGFLN